MPVIVSIPIITLGILGIIVEIKQKSGIPAKIRQEFLQFK